PRAVAHRYRAGVALLGDPAKAARHDGPAVRGCASRNPKHERARRDPSLVPYRHCREADHLLPNEVDAAIVDGTLEPLAFGRRQLAGKHGAGAGKSRTLSAESPFDCHLVEPRQHLLARGDLSAPP